MMASTPLPAMARGRWHEPSASVQRCAVRGLGASLLVLACTACASETSETTTGGPEPTTATSAAASTGTASSDPADDTATTRALEGSTSTDATGVGFIPPEEPNPAFECDFGEQDCPPGEKCTAWANDHGDTWNAAPSGLEDIGACALP